MKVFVVLLGLLACAVKISSAETCEQMMEHFTIPDSFQIPDTKKVEMRNWVRSQALAEDGECLDEIVGMMIKGMEEEEGGEGKRSVHNEGSEKSYVCSCWMISSPVNMHSWSSSSSKSVNVMNSGPLSVTTIDGETHYEIEGKKIDLEKADILEDNDEESIFAPSEVEGAKVTIYKKKQQVVLDYKGHRMVTSNNRNNSFNLVAYN